MKIPGASGWPAMNPRRTPGAEKAAGEAPEVVEAGIMRLANVH
jgi:hypothetical protein